ncbi:MAG: RsmE family RNA methyltransferase, partial [Clostridia bacterium]
LRRFFVDISNINGDIVTVQGDEFLHMTKVLRLKVGFKVIVCANDGIERFSTITKIDKDVATLKIEEEKTVDHRGKSLTLFAGLLKNNKLDFVIQKCVELGVNKIIPFVSSNTAETKFNIERAKTIALEAAKQCGSAYLTEVGELVTLENVAEMLQKFDIALCAYECDKTNRIRETALGGSNDQNKNIALIVGAEGGFKQLEIENLKEKGVKTVTLGRRILRAETADIVASALVLDTIGELDYD